VPAPDIEALIERFVRVRSGDPKGDLHTLVEAQIARITVWPDSICVESAALEGAEDGQTSQPQPIVSLPWSKKPFRAAKGAVWVPPAVPTVSAGDVRDKEVVLTAVGKARRWVNQLTTGDDLRLIASQEGKSERYIRMMIPLAFVPPKRLKELVGGTTVMASAVDVAKGVHLNWQNDISAGLRGLLNDRF